MVNLIYVETLIEFKRNFQVDTFRCSPGGTHTPEEETEVTTSALEEIKTVLMSAVFILVPIV